MATVTGTWVEPEKAPMNRPRNVLLPLNVLLLPTMVTLVCTAGRSAVRVMLFWKTMRSPAWAVVMALLRVAKLVTLKSVAQAGLDRQVPARRTATKPPAIFERTSP